MSQTEVREARSENDIDPAVTELHRRLRLVQASVLDPNREDSDDANDVTHDALQACIALAHEHNPSRFGSVVDPAIARIILGWPDQLDRIDGRGERWIYGWHEESMKAGWQKWYAGRPLDLSELDQRFGPLRLATAADPA